MRRPRCPVWGRRGHDPLGQKWFDRLFSFTASTYSRASAFSRCAGGGREKIKCFFLMLQRQRAALRQYVGCTRFLTRRPVMRLFVSFCFFGWTPATGREAAPPTSARPDRTFSNEPVKKKEAQLSMPPGSM